MSISLFSSLPTSTALRSAWILSAFLCATLFCASVSAQDAPKTSEKAAEETTEKTTEKTAQTKKKRTKKKKSGSGATRDLLDAGRMEFGTNLSGVWIRNKATPSGGEEVTQSTTYFSPSLYFGLTVIPNLQVRLLGGYQSITASVDDVESQNLSSTVILTQGLYHLGLEDGYALYGGLGLGGYFGNTTRPSLDGKDSEIINDTSGFMAQLLAGVLAQPLERLTFRMGVRFDMLFGSETSTFEGYPPETDTSNYQALLELSIGVRFGNGW